MNTEPKPERKKSSDSEKSTSAFSAIMSGKLLNYFWISFIVNRFQVTDKRRAKSSKENESFT